MNGASALKLVTSELTSTPAAPPPTPETPVERRIGELTADACLILTTGMQEYSADGAMAAATKERSGELLAELYQLQQSMMTDDFPQLMHVHGTRVLWQRNPEIFRCHPGTQIDPATFNRGISVLIGHIYAVLAKVTASERIIHQMAN